MVDRSKDKFTQAVRDVARIAVEASGGSPAGAIMVLASAIELVPIDYGVHDIDGWPEAILEALIKVRVRQARGN